MRNRKRLYRWLVVLILTGTLGGLGLLILRTPPPKVSKENFAKIHEGMTREEVEEVLGASQFSFGDVSVGQATQARRVVYRVVCPPSAAHTTQGRSSAFGQDQRRERCCKRVPSACERLGWVPSFALRPKMALPRLRFGLVSALAILTEFTESLHPNLQS
jgi:hypothetical protein